MGAAEGQGASNTLSGLKKKEIKKAKPEDREAFEGFTVRALKLLSQGMCQKDGVRGFVCDWGAFRVQMPSHLTRREEHIIIGKTWQIRRTFHSKPEFVKFSHMPPPSSSCSVYFSTVNNCRKMNKNGNIC